MAESEATLVVSGLEPDTSYTVHVSAGNNVGYGQPMKFRVKTATTASHRDQLGK